METYTKEEYEAKSKQANREFLRFSASVISIFVALFMGLSYIYPADTFLGNSENFLVFIMLPLMTISVLVCAVIGTFTKDSEQTHFFYFLSGSSVFVILCILLLLGMIKGFIKSNAEFEESGCHRISKEYQICGPVEGKPGFTACETKTKLICPGTELNR